MTATTGKYVFDTGSSSSYLMVRKHDNGETYEEECERIPYDPIPKGQYAIEITGFQAPFEMPRSPNFPKEDWQSDTVTKTRLEFTILDGSHAGAVFLGLYTLSFGDRALLGQLLRAVNQGPLPRPFDMEMVIGWKFSALVIHSKDKSGQTKVGRDGNPFPEIVIDSIEPLTEPTELAKKAEKPAKLTRPAEYDARTDPRIGWTAFWEFAKSYGYSKPDDIAKALKKDIEPLGVAELYEALAKHVGHQTEAPF